MKKNILLIILLITSLLSSIALFSGVAESLYITNPSKINVDSTINKKTNSSVNYKLSLNNYNILVMGDSLARGTGDEKGKGFGNTFADLIKDKTKKPVKVTDIGINGDTSSGLLNVISNTQTKNNIAASNIIIISIGANEVKNFRNANFTSISTDSRTVLNNYLNNLKTGFKTIRDLNKTSLIVFIGLYNPFGQEITNDKVSFLEQWNYETDKFVSQDCNSVFIPTYDLFKFNLQNYLSADDFHPNSAGYDAIGKRIFESVSAHSL